MLLVPPDPTFLRCIDGPCKGTVVLGAVPIGHTTLVMQRGRQHRYTRVGDTLVSGALDATAVNKRSFEYGGQSWTVTAEEKYLAAGEGSDKSVGGTFLQFTAEGQVARGRFVVWPPSDLAARADAELRECLDGSFEIDGGLGQERASS